MPALNKQTLINLLIDSPLREPIKINLIDIVNNTSDADLPKTFSTISKELEIFQKATERRMKIAEETAAKLQGEGGSTPSQPAGEMPAPSPTPSPAPDTPTPPPPPPVPQENDSGLSAPKLDLPPLPKTPQMDGADSPAPSMDQPASPPPMEEAKPSTPPPADSADEDALKEIQKELDQLKTSASDEAASAPPPAPQG